MKKLIGQNVYVIYFRLKKGGESIFFLIFYGIEERRQLAHMS
jgi:hypothetical protein